MQQPRPPGLPAGLPAGWRWGACLAMGREFESHYGQILLNCPFGPKMPSRGRGAAGAQEMPKAPTPEEGHWPSLPTPVVALVAKIGGG